LGARSAHPNYGSHHLTNRKDSTVPASNPSSTLPPDADPENALIIETTRGNVVIALRTDVAPAHAERLKMLAREGFYDDVPFHRVIDGFMAQTGDGENGNGTGGSEHPDLKSEFSDVPYKRGTVGMARTSNPHSANSQFFIMFDDGSFLNGQYTVVGEVVSGMDVVDKLKRGEPPSDPDRMVRVSVAADADE
jgi:peptidylprolyl isomerase